MGKSDMIPFQSYQISSDVVAYGNEEMVNDFLRICGPETVSIFLVVNDCAQVEAFSLMTVPPRLNLMKLKTIEICFLKTWIKVFEGRKHGFGSFLELILSEAKGLMEFKFYAQLFSDLDQGDEVIFQQFEEIIAGGLPETLKSLALHMPIHESKLMRLMERGLKLEEFAITWFYPLESETFLKFLESQAATLRGLRIMKTTPEQLTLEFPHFPELVELQLPGVEFPKTFSFLGTFPKLQSLELEERATENTFTGLLPSTTKTAPTLTKLQLPFSFLMAPHVKKFSQCFPNVVELHVSHSPDLEETLVEVFKYFRKVERLYILNKNELNADSVFSGVPWEECRRIRWLPNFDGIKLEELQRKPSILNLTKLKTLVVLEPFGFRQDGSSTKGPGRLNINDFSAHFLFLRMDSMRELHLSVLQRISRGNLRRLREKLRVVLHNGQVVDSDSDSD